MLAYLRRQRERRDLDEFEGLIASPHDLGATAAGQDCPNPLTLPGNARLALSHSAPLAAEDVLVSVGPVKQFTHPALDADEVYRGAWGEELRETVVHREATAPSGEFTLYLVDAFGRHLPIATATFT